MARILVVDDDTDILNIAETVLASAGHTVITAEDAIRAIDLMTQISFDLLITDANMPNYSGYELINTIREKSELKDLSVIMLTGRRERKDIERAAKLGVDDYIVKPLNPALLIPKTNALFDRKPPAHHAEINLRNSSLAQGIIARSVRVESISEVGIQITTEMVLRAGQMLDITAEVFKELGVDAPPMKVQRADFDPQTGLCRAHLIFLSAKPKLLQKIRRWLYTRGPMTRAS